MSRSCLSYCFISYNQRGFRQKAPILLPASMLRNYAAALFGKDVVADELSLAAMKKDGIIDAVGEEFVCDHIDAALTKAATLSNAPEAVEV